MPRFIMVTVAGAAFALAACSGGSTGNAPVTTVPTTSATTAAGSTSSAPATTPTTSASSAPSAAGTADVSSSGDIPDNQVFITYQPPSGGYSVKVPEGWARTEGTDNVSFTDKANTVTLRRVAQASAPTVDSVKADLSSVLADASNPALGAVDARRRAGGQAVVITYQADSAPSPVTGKVVRLDVERDEFWKAGTTVVLTMSSPRGADNVDPWKLIADSFTWTS